MKFEEIVTKYRNLPVIETENLRVGYSDSLPMEVQLSRWRKQGKIIKLKRGLYVLSEPYRKIEVYIPYVAAILQKPSYISLEKALEYHDLIPEAVPVYSCVTTGRTGKFVSKLGIFDYKHVKESLFWGYESVTVNRQTAFIASPEKCLLDLVYLRKVDISVDYFVELRLQNVEKIDKDKLLRYAGRFNKPKILRAAKLLKKYVENYQKKERNL